MRGLCDYYRVNSLPKVVARELLNSPRLRIGTEPAMMVEPPDVRPAPPRPATARPIMRTTELGAVAHMIDPISKRNSAERYVHLTWK